MPIPPAAPAAFVAVLGLVLLSGPPATAAVKVVKAKPVVEHKTFDPADPPEDLPPLEPGVQGACQVFFGSGIDILHAPAGRRPKGDRCQASVRVHNLTVNLSLRIVVWLPKGANAKLKAHEEGHRRISERVYETAEAAARAAAKKLDARRLDGEGDTCPQAVQDALTSAGKRFSAEYVSAVADRAKRINTIYDELTDHGRRRLGEDDAIRQAFEREEAERGGAGKDQGKPKPATKGRARAKQGRAKAK